MPTTRTTTTRTPDPNWALGYGQGFAAAMARDGRRMARDLDPAEGPNAGVPIPIEPIPDQAEASPDAWEAIRPIIAALTDLGVEDDKIEAIAAILLGQPASGDGEDPPRIAAGSGVRGGEFKSEPDLISGDRRRAAAHDRLVRAGWPQQGDACSYSDLADRFQPGQRRRA